jgi:predicted Zn-dependent protease
VKDRAVRRLAATAILSLVLTLSSSSAEASSQAGRSVVLVPIGSFSQPSVQALAHHLQQKFHLRVLARGALPLPPGSYDGSRKQYVGEKLLAELEQAYRQGVVIAITDRDMYMAARSYRFVFSIRDQRASVASSARMDPRFYGLPADTELWYSRLDKMAGKMVGVLALGRRESANPRSVLFGGILGVDDLDFMSEDLRPHPYPADKRAWLAGADRACNTARAQTAALGNRPTQTSEQLLAVLTDAIKFESDLLNAINALPTPHSDRTLLAKLRTTFTRAVTADRNALAALTAQWDMQKFKDLLAANETASAGLRSTSLRLGSRPCAAYFG